MSREIDAMLASVDLQEDVERHARAFNNGLAGEGDRRAVKARIARRQRDTEQRMADAQEALDCVAAGMTYTETATCMNVTRSKVAGLVRVARLQGMSPRASAAKK
jgi:DNA-binding CsgD family transcriptional regulator